jgi:hypothetical protein
MKPTDILFPAIAQALLTLVVLLLMGPAKARSMREQGQTMDDTDVALGRNAWSEQVIKISNNYKNQFEVPVLFFAVVAFALIAGAVDVLMLSLAWIFVLSRLVHAAVHIGPNIVMWRGLAFVVGVAAVLAMWLKLLVHLF